MILARGFRLLRYFPCCRTQTQLTHSLHSKHLENGKKICVPVLLAIPALSSVDINQKERLKAPDPSTLTHSYLIRNACASSVDSVSALFHQTVCALLEAEQQYAEAVYTLISLLEFHLTSLNLDETEQSKIWDLIIAQKQVVQERKDDKQELELLYQSVDGVMNGLAQAAFLAGADLSGIRTGEELFSVQSHLRQAKQVSNEAEHKLTEIDVKVIQVTSEHDQKDAEKLDSEGTVAPDDVAYADTDDD